jgi:hypothetical protein
MSVTCPKCGLMSPQGAEECDCGYNFATGKFTPKPDPPPGTGASTYLTFVAGAAFCWGWMIFTLAERGLHPSTLVAALYFVVLVLLTCGFGSSFLRLSKRSQWSQMTMLIPIITLMAVAGSFAWQLGFSDEGVFIGFMGGGIVLVAGLYWLAARVNKKRGY